MRIGKKTSILVLLVISAVTHFLFFGHPKETVFDEVHFGKFISAYSTHEYYFDIHPPLGKLIIAGFGNLFDFKPEFSFAEIGDKFPDNKYLALRFLPALAGTLLPLVLFLLALELGFSREGAFTLGILTAFENALIVQSRLILLDAFLLLFGFTALWLYFRYRPVSSPSGNDGASNGRSWYNLIGVGIFAGLAISIKWTGLTFLALPGIMEMITIIRHKHWGHILKVLGTLLLIPVVLYSAVFVIHFSLLTKSGGGDAFMTPEFQKTLKGNPNESNAELSTPNIFSKIVELNAEMYRANQTLTATHPYGSKWYTWPFMIRSIYYWVDASQRIYFIGNPLIWWLSTIAVVFLSILFIIDRKERTTVAYVLLGSYSMNLLPFVGITRVMFLYHYLTALVFALIMLVYLIDRMKHRKKAFGALIFISLVTFVYFAPLTYGLPLTPNNYQHRLWLNSWE